MVWAVDASILVRVQPSHVESHTLTTATPKSQLDSLEFVLKPLHDSISVRAGQGAGHLFVQILQLLFHEDFTLSQLFTSKNHSMPRWCQNQSDELSASTWVSLKIVYPIYPMVLLIIIPIFNGYFIGNINPTCSDKAWPELHWIGTPWVAVPAVPLLAHFSRNHQASMTNAGTCIAGYGRTHRSRCYPQYVSYSNILWDVDQLEVNVCETGYGRVFGPDSSRGQPWAFPPGPKVENVGERLLTKKDWNGGEELLGRLILWKWHPAALSLDYQGQSGTTLLVFICVLYICFTSVHMIVISMFAWFHGLAQSFTGKPWFCWW